MSDFSIVPNHNHHNNNNNPNDNSYDLWGSVIYELWPISDICDDLFDRIQNMTQHNYYNTIKYVYEGIRILRDRSIRDIDNIDDTSTNCDLTCNEIIMHLRLRESLIENDKKIEMKKQKIEDDIISLQIEIEHKLVLFEEGIYISLDEIFIRKMKINKELKLFESMGAKNEDIKMVSKFIKLANSELESLLLKIKIKKAQSP
jgi:hypothetical protein